MTKSYLDKNNEVLKKQSKVNFYCVVMFMMTSKVLKFVDSQKLQKSEHHENKTLFFV